MNYLAHLFLASDEKGGRIGGLLGDFVKGDLKYTYSRGIQIEMQIHHLIDSYTDGHVAIREAKKLVEEGKRRYMGIALDVFYDHMLATKWNTYSSEDLHDFTQRMYQLLLKNKAILPDHLKRMVPIMIQQDWLTSYQDFESVKHAIYRLSTRLTRGDLLLKCIPDMEDHYFAFSSGFDEFFPQLIDYVHQQRRMLYAS